MDYYDLQMLAGAVLNLTEDQIDEIIDNGEDFDTPLLEKFSVDFEQFIEVTLALLPLTPVIRSAITKDFYHAFVNQLENGDSIAIVKQKVRK